MLCIKPPLALLILILAAACALLGAQTSSDPRPAQIDTGNRSLGSAGSIEMLSPDQMTRHDRDLEADAEATIQERAGFENLEFNEFAPREMIEQGDTVVVLGTLSGRAKKTGKSVKNEWAHVFKYKQGKVVYFQEYIDTAADVLAMT